MSLLLYYADELKSVDRGKNHCKSNHVEAFVYSAGYLREKVQASMKTRSYKITVSSLS